MQLKQCVCFSYFSIPIILNNSIENQSASKHADIQLNNY